MPIGPAMALGDGLDKLIVGIIIIIFVGLGGIVEKETGIVFDQAVQGIKNGLANARFQIK
jgi:hypothetical protein